MLSGVSPFRNEVDRRHHIKLGTYFPLTGRLWENISIDAQDLVEKILKVDPAERIDINGILSHPWLQKAQSEGSEDSKVFDAAYTSRMKNLELKDKLRKCFNFDIQVKRESFRGNLQKKQSSGEIDCRTLVDDISNSVATSTDNAAYVENFGYNTNLQNLRCELVAHLITRSKLLFFSSS